MVASRIALVGYQVYRPLADDRGVDLVVDLGGGRHAMVQVKSVRKLPSYVFMRKSTFAVVPWVAVAVVVFEDGEECPEIFLIPAREWLDPPHPLVDRPYGEGLKSPPEFGVSINRGWKQDLARWKGTRQHIATVLDAARGNRSSCRESNQAQKSS